MDLKRTPLFVDHQKIGAKMVAFAGFEMPVTYSGVIEEHKAVRESVGLFDVSHMGEIWVKGKNALPFLQYVTTNDVSKLKPGKAQYSCLPNGKGGIVDDILVYQYSSDKYFLVVNASNVKKDWEWLNTNNIMHAELENATDQIAQLALQGPKATELLQKLTQEDLQHMPPFSFKVAHVAGIKDVIVSTTGYTGAGGYELYLNHAFASQLWNALLVEGVAYGIKPCGLASRDTLRLEKGYCLYGNDIDDSTSPIEAGLGWIVPGQKKNNFIDKELLFNQKRQGVQRQLVGLLATEKGIPRNGYGLEDLQGNAIGVVTSGTMSASLNQPIGMGYVASHFSRPGTELNISIRNKKIRAKVVPLPFL
jgi:aminomethyltransferase